MLVYQRVNINKQLYAKTLCAPMPPTIVGIRHGIPKNLAYHDPNKNIIAATRKAIYQLHSTTISPNPWVNPPKKQKKHIHNSWFIVP